MDSRYICEATHINPPRYQDFLASAEAYHYLKHLSINHIKNSSGERFEKCPTTQKSLKNALLIQVPYPH